MWCKDYVMTAKQDAVINELNTKVERLIKLYISSLDKNREIKTLKVAAAISTGEGSSEAKNRISQLVREIDKCIALLNN